MCNDLQWNLKNSEKYSIFSYYLSIYLRTYVDSTEGFHEAWALVVSAKFRNIFFMIWYLQ